MERRHRRRRGLGAGQHHGLRDLGHGELAPDEGGGTADRDGGDGAEDEVDAYLVAEGARLGGGEKLRPGLPGLGLEVDRRRAAQELGDRLDRFLAGALAAGAGATASGAGVTIVAARARTTASSAATAWRSISMPAGARC